MIDIHNLQKQLPLNDAPYKTQALNVLTAEQKTKVPKLTEALQLQTTAGEAGMLLLIDYPAYGPPKILPATWGCFAEFAGLPVASPASASGAKHLAPAQR